MRRLSKIKPAQCQATVARLRAILADEKLLELMRDSNGVILPDGAEKRTHISKLADNLQLICDVLDTYPEKKLLPLQAAIYACRAAGIAMSTEVEVRYIVLVFLHYEQLKRYDVITKVLSKEALPDDVADASAAQQFEYFTNASPEFGVELTNMVFTEYLNDIGATEASAKGISNAADRLDKLGLIGDGFCADGSTTLKSIRATLDDMDSHDVTYLQDLRLKFKSAPTGSSLSSFMQSTLGSTRMVVMDARIAKMRKTAVVVQSLETLKRVLVSAESQGLLEASFTDLAYIRKHFTKLRKELMGIIANAPPEVMEAGTDPHRLLNECTAVFSATIKHLEYLYNTLLDDSLVGVFEAMNKIRVAADEVQSSQDSVSPEQICLAALAKCRKVVPDAQPAGVVDLADADTVRSWAASNLVRERLFAAIELWVTAKG